MSEFLSLIAPIKLLPRRLQAVGGVVALLALPVVWPLEVAGTYAWMVGTTIRQREVRYGLMGVMIGVAVLFEGFWLHQSWLFVAGGASRGGVHPGVALADDKAGEVAGAETNDGTSAPVKGLQGSLIVVDWRGQPTMVRLLGVQVPQAEINGVVECYGQEAVSFLSTMVSGQTVKLQSDPGVADKDEAGHLQRYVFLSNGTLLNQLLLSQGDARLDDSLSTYQYKSVFTQAQQQAQGGKIGLWASCDPAVTPTPDGGQPTPTPDGKVLGVNQLLAHPQPGPSPTPLPGGGKTFGDQSSPPPPLNIPTGYQTSRSTPTPTSTPHPTATPTPVPTTVPTPIPTATPMPTPVPEPTDSSTPS